MWRLHTHPARFEGIELARCGLMFLSTPHCGTSQADWSRVLASVCEATLGLKSHDILDELRSFNTSSVDSAENFSAITPRPPFHCFCEARSTSIAGQLRTVCLTG